MFPSPGFCPNLVPPTIGVCIWDFAIGTCASVDHLGHRDGAQRYPPSPVFCMADLNVSEAWDWRSKAVIPQGQCLYIQSGDPGDFDGKAARGPSQATFSLTSHTPPFSGYLIGVAGHELEKHTKDMLYAIVVRMAERAAASSCTEI